ncbi:MAG: aldehyde dehydrogenase [Oligoflexales bacterium]
MSFKDFLINLKDKRFPMDFPGHFIDSQWVKAGKSPVLKETNNPSQGEKIFDVRLDKAHLDQAITSTISGAERFANLKIEKRIEFLDRFTKAFGDYAPQIQQCLQINGGKPRWEAECEVSAALKLLRHTCSSWREIEASFLANFNFNQQVHKVYLKAAGPTLALLPFTTPVTTFAQYFVASILSGSPLLMVCSGNAGLTGVCLSYLVEALELPPGSFNMVFGNFTTYKQVSLDKRFQCLLYLGSREHCDQLRKENLSVSKRQVVLQSGGKNALLVHSSADLDKAIKWGVQGAIRSGGQLCTSTSRIFVYKNLLDKFVEGFKAAMEEVRIGPTDGDSGNPDMGPLYSKKAIDKFLRFQTMALREKGKTVLRGQDFNTGTNGYFVRPGVHLMEAFDASKAYQSNVLMCPDVAIYEYEVLETAIDQINTTDAPFVVSFAGDPAIVASHAHMFLAPNVIVNQPTSALELTMPIAGKRQCGHHRFNGAGLSFLLTYPQAVIDSAAFYNEAWPSSKI